MCFFFTVLAGRQQQFTETRYVVSKESIALPCAVPGVDNYLRWKFQANGSTFAIDAGQVFVGGIPKIFGQFDLPP